MRARVSLFAAVALACLACTHGAPPAGPAAGGSGGVNRPEHAGKPYVVLVSLDGFRSDYLDREDVPNLRRLADRGARAEALVPVFPSLTFPNHYSLVTGLFPDRHGIVANSFWDPGRRQAYSLSDRAAVADGTWYRGEPIWVTAETQGMVASCFFWPGSEAAIKGVRPTAWRPYDSAVSREERVRTVLDWLRLPAERRPHVITVYFSDVDSASHAGGLDAPAVGEAIRAVDRTIGALLDGIDALSIRDHVYLIVTSDHGMVETTARQTVRLETLVNMSAIARAFGGPVASLHLRNHGDAERVRDELNSGLQHGRAYLRDEVPERHHYRGDARIGEVVAIMDEGWRLEPPPRVPGWIRRRWGAHGWDPALPAMHAIFIAAGPRISPGERLPPIRTVDVYPLLAALLDLRTPPDIDGRLPDAARGWIEKVGAGSRVPGFLGLRFWFGFRPFSAEPETGT